MKIICISAVVAIILVPITRGQPPPPSFSADRVLPSHSAMKALLSPGMLFSIYGQDLGPAVGCEGRAEPAVRDGSVTGEFPRQLCAVQVLVGTEPAGLLYMQERQINFKVPRNLPPQGTAQLKVVFEGRSSLIVQLEIGWDGPTLSLEGVARVNGPVWIRVELPYGLGAVAYPGGNPPLDFGCNQVEVRRNGIPLVRKILVSSQGIVGPGNGCGNDLAYPGSSRTHTGRLPLQLQYRFDTPGIYEVRYARVRSIFTREVRTQSEWTKINILPAIPALAKVAPTAATEILGDFLPGILGFPNEATLSLVMDCLYHPDDAVRRYAASALDWWPEAEVHRRLAEIIRTKGPSDVVMGRYSTRPAPELIDPMLPYLQSDNPVLLRGAVIGLGWLLRTKYQRTPAEVETRAESAILAATERLVKMGDPEILSNLALTLGAMQDDRAHDVLWNFVERGVAREQSLIVISWRKDVRDLARLGSLLTVPATGDPLKTEFSRLPYALRNSYGEAALPFLEDGLQRSGYVFVRTACARELVLAGRSSGFAFILKAIEDNERYRQELTQFVQDRFPEIRGADAGALVAFLKQRAK